MDHYTAIITIDTDTADNAQQVLNKRLNYDEDYGFP